MTNRDSRRHVRSVNLALLLGLFLAAGAADASDLKQVLAGFDRAQAEVQTLSAEFVQTTTNPLLIDPIRAEGSFFMTKPDAIRWEFSTPEKMSFVIANDRYTGYFPARKRAERKNIKRYSERIFRYFGMGQQSIELTHSYDIRLESSALDEEGNFLLVLRPKKRRARKRVEEIRFWVDGVTFLPVKVQYTAKDGGTRLVEFTEIRVNPDLSASLYTMEIPADVTVTTGFGGVPSLSPGSTQ